MPITEAELTLSFDHRTSCGQSHILNAPLLAIVFVIGLLSVPIIHGAGSGTADIPLFDPGKYNAEQLATSSLNDGIPDVWKTWYGLSVIDSTVLLRHFSASSSR